MKKSWLFPILLLFSCSLPESEELSNIQIVRDEWGVPHIFAPTDREVAYGLGWAQCEDDFNTLQEQMLAVRGLLGEVKGQDGAIRDFAVNYMGIKEVVKAKYDSDVTGAFRDYLEGYVAGVNNYAVLHPEEWLLDDLFPISGQEVIVGYLMANTEISGAFKDLLKIMENNIHKEVADNFPKGSNAIAISRKKTTENKTYLAINSHQPLEGWYSWYEAHLVSEEGLNILGGTFPGGVSIIHGANENLGWALTVNHADFSDVYKLTIHPEKEDHYQFDGEWLPLEEMTYRSWVKVWQFIKIPITKSIFKSKYGPTFKTETGEYYAWRFVAGQGIRAAEQFYNMNKARHFEAFQKALRIQGIPSLNIVYADKEDNIYYLSNGRLPKRDPGFNWKEVLPGNTSATLWEAEDYYPIDSLPQVLNPESGYVFNTNNTPFSSSGENDNPRETLLNHTLGYQKTGLNNNRADQFMNLIEQYERLDYQDFKAIKFNTRYPDTLREFQMTNLELLLNLDPEKHPDLADGIRLLNNWDRNTNVDNTSAAFFIRTLDFLKADQREKGRYVLGNTITEEECLVAIQKAKDLMIKKYGSISIPLGTMQRHIRGDKNLPLGGGPDVLAAMYSSPDDNEEYKGQAGESYIELVRFGPEGVKIESVNAYGASAKPGSPHFTDQMELFTKQQLKPMTLDKQTVFDNAQRIYSPLKVK